MTEVMKYAHTELEAEIRVIERDGEPWFVANDVTKVLGFSNGPKAVRDHVFPGHRRVERIVHPSSKSRYFIGDGKDELFNSHTGNPLVTMKGVEVICDFYGLKG